MPHELEGKNLLVTGYIASLPVNKSHRISFEFQTDTIGKVRQKSKLKLGWYGDSPLIVAGDRWQLLVRLKRAHGMLNPGGFDAEKQLFIHHLRATGYVVKGEFNRILPSHFYHYPLTRLRQFLIERMEQALIFHPLTPVWSSHL